MSSISPSKSTNHNGTLIVCALFVLAGIITLYDTTSYTDRDSKVFPQAVAIILIITASIAFVVRFLNPSNEGGFGQGVWWRRVLLVVTMLLTCIAMPFMGFLFAGGIAFAGGLIAAMHDKWSPRTMSIYWGSGTIIMIAFFGLFKFVLHVPLP